MYIYICVLYNIINIIYIYTYVCVFPIQPMEPHTSLHVYRQATSLDVRETGSWSVRPDILVIHSVQKSAQRNC